jgi:crotonobetainyl-CoA:carnitine CoA-transferase CaiB-like acyl-CoA transferase
LSKPIPEAVSSTPTSSGPLAGLRILDLTTVIMGPYGTRILADMGADVIKIEPPEGDTFRNYGPLRHEQMSGSVLNLHRNKRSVRLDLKDEGARAALRRLIAGADALVHNLRPQAAARLGLDWGSVAAIHPGLVLCAARGFSQAGPYGDKAAYDDLMQAGSGFTALNEELTGEPRYAPTAWCDKIAGQAIANAVLGALLHRQRGGGGQEVEVPMFEVAIDFMLVEHYGAAAFEPPLGKAGFKRQLSRTRKPYRTRDGWACILPYSDRNWKDFFAFIGRPELGDDPRYQALTDRVTHIDALYALIAEHAPRHSTRAWVEFCDRVSIPCMPVLKLDELKDDPHVVATGFMPLAQHPSEGAYREVRSPLRFGATPYALRRHAPRVGEHTAEVLREAGLPESEVARLASAR